MLGMIGGFLALGINPWGAARLAWTLREAGKRAAKEFGPGMLPEDVIPFISRCLNSTDFIFRGSPFCSDIIKCNFRNIQLQLHFDLNSIHYLVEKPSIVER